MYYVHPEAKIGNNVTIGNFTNIYENVEIGDNCEIAGNVTIYPGARIGSGVKIFPGAVISAIPQDLKFRGEETYAYVGDGTTLRVSLSTEAQPPRVRLLSGAIALLWLTTTWRMIA